MEEIKKKEEEANKLKTGVKILNLNYFIKYTNKIKF